jgi:uncharacterized membrane protein YkvA (DUF1232 family)
VNGGADEHATASALGRLGARSSQALRAIVLDIRCLYFVFTNPGTPWYARALLFLPLAYLCSPIQLIPNFIPVLGQMDDLFVIWLSNRLVRRLVDAKVLNECRERAAAVSFSIRFSGKSFYARHAEPPTAPASSAADAAATPAGVPPPDGAAGAQETAPDTHASRSAI